MLAKLTTHISEKSRERQIILTFPAFS